MNPMDLLKNFKDIQSRVTEMQDKLKDVLVRGTAGGDMVQIEMNGQMEVLGVTVAPEVVDPSEVGMLQDLIMAAMNDAQAKVKEKLQGEFAGLAGGIPPGFMGL